LCFADITGVFPTLFHDVDLIFSMTVERNGKLTIKCILSDMDIAFSLADIKGFTQITESIMKTADTFLSVRAETSALGTIRLSLFHFQIGGLRVAFCRENRSSQLPIPFAELLIPPVQFSITSETEENSMHGELMPCLLFYNQITGEYDMIIERFLLVIESRLSETDFECTIEVSGNLNVNIPLAVIHQILNLDIPNQTRTTTSDYPEFWVENLLGFEIMCEINSRYYPVAYGQYLPIYGITRDSLLNVQIRNYSVEFKPYAIVYPSYISQGFAILKSPFQGGYKLSFIASVQIENQLSISLLLYKLLRGKNEFRYVTTIEPNSRTGITFGSVREKVFSFTHDPKLSGTRVTLKISDSAPIRLSINSPTGTLFCIKTVYDDKSTGSRIHVIKTQVMAMNHLHIPLFVKPTRGDPPIMIGPGLQAGFGFIDWSTREFSAVLSADPKVFLTGKTTKLDPKVITYVSYLTSERIFERTAIKCDTDKDPSQIHMHLYYPCVFFNISTLPLTLIEPQRNGSSFALGPGLSRSWCPSFLSTPGQMCNITLRISELPSEVSDPIDCQTAGVTPVWLCTARNSPLFYAYRCTIKTDQTTAVITFSSLLRVRNELAETVSLTVIGNIPTSFSDEMIGLTGLSEITEGFDQKYEIQGGTTGVLDIVSQAGVAAISLAGSVTAPVLTLHELQKTVFRIELRTSWIVLVLEVIDDSTGFLAILRKGSFRKNLKS
jgi:hypothetical protein